MHKYQKGQTLLITLLVLTVAVTVALSLIARATTDIRLTSQIEESARAFSAAEAGIEQALKTNIAGSAVIADATNTRFETSIVMLGNEDIYAPDKLITVGNAATIWLVHHNEDGTLNLSDPSRYTPATLDVCWEKGSSVPAAEIVVYYFNIIANDYFVLRGAYDPDATRRADNGFSNVTDASSGCGTTGVSMQTVNLPVAAGDMPLFVRIRPYYASTKIRVASPVGSMTLPDQGQAISSTGLTGDGVTRKIEVQREYDAFPSDFDYVLYNQNSLGH